MPTISGLRRRGYTPESIRDFCARIGVAKKENVIDVAQLEHSVREDLNRRAPRVMAVLRPLKVVHHELPGRPGRGGRRRQQSRGSRRPARARCRSRACSTSSATTSGRIRRRSSSACRPGREVRLRCAYFITCTEVVKDAARRDRRAALHLRSGDARRRRAGRPEGEGDAALGVGRARGARRRSGSTIASSRWRIPSGTRTGKTFLDNLNPQSLEVLRDCLVEPSLARRDAGRAVPVRAPRLLLRRSRLASRRARLQPHRVAARHVGEDRAEGRQAEWNITSRSTTSSRARSKFSTSRSSSASFRARRPPRRSSAG